MRGGPLWTGALLALGCRSHPLELSAAPSFLPNLGVAVGIGVPVAPESPWRLEARFTDQFLDDKTFADNTLPEAGNWTQLDLGLQRVSFGEDGRAWTMRFGLVGFEARGEPNIVEESGEYFGVYWGMGRFTTLGPSLSFGPEVTLLAAHGPDPRVLIPQITWGLRWCPGRKTELRGAP